jgi:hypothetical protein
MGLSLGLTGDEPEFVAAVEKATKVSKECKIPLLGGTFPACPCSKLIKRFTVAVGPEMVKLRIDQGYRILVCCLDLHTFVFGMISTVKEARAAAEEHMQTLHK